MKYEILKLMNEFDNNQKFIVSLVRNKKYQHLREDIINATFFLQDVKIGERVYCIINEIKEIPICKCGKSVRYKQGLEGYREYCNIKCVGGFVKDKISESLKKSYSNRGDDIKNKRINTIQKRYGCDNPMQHDTFKAKAKKTLFKNTGYEFALQNPISQDKYKLTSIERYGVDNYAKLDDHKDKTPFKNKKVREKIYNTIQEKYGGYGNISSNSYSKISQELFWKIYENISENLKQKTYFAELNKEFDIFYGSKKQFYYDFVISNIKFCIEFNGNYWHADPEIYEKNSLIKGKLASDIWNKDYIKKQKLEDRGFKVLTIWENEYLDDKEGSLEKITNLIYDYTKI